MFDAKIVVGEHRGVPMVWQWRDSTSRTSLTRWTVNAVRTVSGMSSGHGWPLPVSPTLRS
jgi:DNA/RNA-binding domain of Phe-tRNA-synthetase-like protein